MAVFKSELLAYTLEAAADYTADQFTFMDVDTNGRAVQVSSAGGRAIGVLQDKPSALGQAAKIQFGGVTKVVAGAAVTMGDDVQSDGNGEAINALTGDIVLGVAMETAAAQGEIISVHIGIASRIHA